MAARKLVIAEKPSVAREIAKVLGSVQMGQGCIYCGTSYIVTWALGHLVTLADPEEYDDRYKKWSLDTLPMLPKKMKLVVIKETSKQFKTVRELLNRPDVAEVIIATDSGREGELVARWILIKAGCKKPAKRLWISSQTAKAVREGFATLKPASDYDNLYQSAQARAEADWLVGLNVTRALTCKHNAQLSGGRVQTPTLALVCAREAEIRDFRPKDYYMIRAKFDGFTALWTSGKASGGRLYEKAQAEAVLEKTRGRTATAVTVSKQYKRKAPPAAYDLTELQRDANRRFAYSAKETLSLAQSLYERHKILTYPRTDSRYITEDVAATIPERLRGVAVGPYKEYAQRLLREKPQLTHIVNAAKVGDHHAIIPTEEPPLLSALSPEERNIYDLVVKRFFAVLSTAFEYEETAVTLELGGETFTTKGKVVKSPGWQSVYGGRYDDDEQEDSQAGNLPPIRQGDKYKPLAVNIESGKTKPPARYTEATLLSAMENPHVDDKALREQLRQTSGLGTPATRADIIEKLFSSFYMERRGKEIVPTSKGIQLISIVPPDLKSAELTAKWEQVLTQISKGQAKSGKFIDDMRAYATGLVSSVVSSNAVYRHDNISGEKCPECGKLLLEVNGKKGRMLVCQDRECGYRKSTSVQTNARCPNCHKKLDLRTIGESRIFVCPCGHREKLEDFEKRRSESGAGKREVNSYLEKQSKAQSPANTAMAEALSKWMKKSGL